MSETRTNAPRCFDDFHVMEFGKPTCACGARTVPGAKAALTVRRPIEFIDKTAAPLPPAPRYVKVADEILCSLVVGGVAAAAFRFTIDVSPDPEHPSAWVATCHELGSTSAARTPHGALAALGGAVKLVVGGILEARGTPGSGLEVLREIAAGYAAQRRALDAEPRP